MNVIDAGEMNLVVSLYGQFLHNHCMRLCARFGRCSNEANDVFSDVWVKIFAPSDKGWPPAENEKEWKRILPVVARHTLFDRHKKDTRRVKRELKAGTDRAMQHKGRIEDVAEVIERREAIEAALEACTPRMRAVVRLWLAEKTWDEISAQLDVGKSQVRRDWNEAKFVIGRKLQRIGWSFP
jgi:RNA polymerase sigma factor (sigma-70 family)